MKNILEKAFIIIGILIVLYPFVSNWIISNEEKKLITRYEEKTENLSNEQIGEIRKKADEYNSNLDNERINVNSTVKNSNFVSYYNALNLGNIIAYINIPKINVNLPIYHGTSEGVLESGVGCVENTSLPLGGTGTHSVLSAHTGLIRAKMFDNLNKLEIDDVFYIHVLDDILQYKVDQIKTVLPEEIDDLKIYPDKDYITLVTCTPYLVNTHRLLVRGSRVEDYIYEENKESVLDTTDNNSVIKKYSNSTIKLVFIVLLIVVIILMIVVYRISINKKVKRKPRIGKEND